MKKGLVLVIGLILAASLAGAEFSVDKNNSFIDGSYFGGDFVKGRVKMSFQNQVDKEFSARFNGTESSVKISLLEVLNKMNYSSRRDYSCEPANCKVGFETFESGSSEINSPISKIKRYYGFKIVDNLPLTDITSFKFNISSDVGESCNNQMVIDLFADGSWDYYNNKRSNVDCGVAPLSGCFSNDEWGGDEAVIDKDYYYCEKIENIPPAAGYDLKTNVKTISRGGGLKLVIVEPGKWQEPCVPSSRDINNLPLNSYGEISCFANLSRKTAFDGFVCITQTGTGGEYWIKEEPSEPCGVSISVASPGLGRLSTNLPPEKDFQVSVVPMTYAPIGKMVFNSELYGRFNSGAGLIPAVKKYVNDTYNSNCSLAKGGCIIPFGIWGIDQNIVLNAGELRYKSGGTVHPPISNFYSLEKKDFTISSNASIFDIGKMEFKVPNKKSAYRFELFFSEEKILNRTINVDVGFDFSIGPRAAFVGQNTVFTIYPKNNETISSVVWKFGDGSLSISSSGTRAEHIYRNESEYTVEVSATTNTGEVSSKTFKVIAGDAKESANQTLIKDKARIAKIKSDINSFPQWIKDQIKSQINLETIETSVNTLQTQFNQFSSSGASSSQYLTIINQLLELDVPYSIIISNSGTLPGVAGYNYINPTHIISLSGSSGAAEPQKVKEGIVLWMEENYGLELSFKTYSAVGDSGQKNLFSEYGVKATRKGSATDSGNLIINYPLSSIVFNSNYGAKSVEGTQATYIPTDGVGFGAGDIKFLILGTSTPEAETLGIYISPVVSKLGVSTGTITPYEPQGFSWGKFLFGLIFILVLVFVVYLLLQSWYKRHYEKSLFKNPNDLYNMLNFIYNSRKGGLKDKDIRKALLGKKWSGERVTYAFNKIDGRRTGMWEIPLFKFLENKKVKQELEKKQGRPIDARFFGQGAQNINSSGKVKNIPTGVKVIAILNWIGAAGLILSGLLSFAAKGIFSSIGGGLFESLGNYILISGFIFILIGAIYLFSGIGLWKGRNWARLLNIIFASIGTLISIFVLIKNPVSFLTFGLNIIINLFIIFYLLMSEGVKEAFS